MHLKRIPGTCFGETSTLRYRLKSSRASWGMIASGFHRHFRALTPMSPLQLQKQLRLQESRFLMMSKGLDAASTDFRVRYADALHFTHAY
jgi:AraC-like DNA-binding protein